MGEQQDDIIFKATVGCVGVLELSLYGRDVAVVGVFNQARCVGLSDGERLQATDSLSCINTQMEKILLLIEYA